MALWPAQQAVYLDRLWSRRGLRGGSLVVTGVVALQLYFGHGALDRFVPTPKDWKVAESFVEELKGLPEPVLCPYAPYALVQAGKDPTFSLIALWDIDYEGGPYRPFVAEVDQAMAEHHWASAVLPDDKLGHGIKRYYQRDHFLKTPSPGTLVGWPVRLNQVWLPREQPLPEEPSEPEDHGDP
jgi:hypothetical protein